MDIMDVCYGNRNRDNDMQNDLISRQAAINVADMADYTGLSVEDVKKVTDEVVKELKALPSAQPELIRCADCKYWRSNTQFCMMFTEMNVAHRMPEDGFCSLAERREYV